MKDLERMTPAELTELLRADFQAEDSGESDMDEILRAAEILAAREPSAGDGDRAWESFRKNYLPLAGEGASLYGDSDPPGGSDAARGPRHSGFAVWKRLGRIAAAVLLAVLLGGGILLAADEEARAAFAGWVRELCGGDFFEYSFQGQEDSPAGGGDDAEPAFCAPSWVPEGYMLEDIHEGGERMITYSGGEGLGITFCCFPPDGSGMSVYDTDVQRAEVNGKPADLYPARREGEITALIWEDENIGALFWLSGFLSEEELIRIAESVQVTEPIQPPHRPGWIPEGWAFFSDSSGQGDLQGQWQREDGDLLRFRCVLGETHREMMLEELEAETVELEAGAVSVGGEDARLYRAGDGVGHLVWSGDGGALYWIRGALSDQDLLRMAESVPGRPE